MIDLAVAATWCGATAKGSDLALIAAISGRATGSRTPIMALEVLIIIEVSMHREMPSTAIAAAVDFADHDTQVLVPTVVAPNVLLIVAKTPAGWTERFGVLFAGLVVRVVADHHIVIRCHGATLCTGGAVR